MTTYKDAGVDVEAGDAASCIAYQKASETFQHRSGMIGEPVFEEGGFGGMLDMGDYYLVQSADGTGTKIDMAYEVGNLSGLGYDLLAMVADDIVCTGAEVISVSNCIDTAKVRSEEIEALMSGLASACKEQRIVIPAGEIAEVPGAVSRSVWSASGIGVVKKDRVLNSETIQEGDVVIALQSGVARCNGFSLIRKIMIDSLGEEWHSLEWKNGQSWSDALLTPSIIYHDAILSLIGRFDEEPKMTVKSVAHITGGGIPSKFRRSLKATGLGCELTSLWQPHDAMKDIISMGSVDLYEAYSTWNMGNGMLIVVDKKNAELALDLLSKTSVKAQIAGKITKNSDVKIDAFTGESLIFGA